MQKVIATIMGQKLNTKLKELFCNDLNSDIKFHLENENITYPAHKLIIGLGSEVLYNMVYGSGTTLPASTIIVPNYSSKDFLPVLKYIYTGELEWNFDNYDVVLAVGKYFGLIELENLFNIYVANTINYDNALDIYARFYHRNDIASVTAMKIIRLVLSRILNSETEMFKFFGLPAEAQAKILSMDELGIASEDELFKKMMIWSEKATIDQENLSSVLGSQIKLIRFADMKIKEYSQFEEFLHAECNTRWKIRVFQETKAEKRKKLNGEDKLEIIRITARHKAIRIHGLSTSLLPDAVYLENKLEFETIPFVSSKIFKNACFDLMFENAIEIAKNTTIQLKVPARSNRYSFKEHDSIFLQAIYDGSIVNSLSIPAIFVSMR